MRVNWPENQQELLKIQCSLNEQPTPKLYVWRHTSAIVPHFEIGNVFDCNHKYNDFKTRLSRNIGRGLRFRRGNTTKNSPTPYKSRPNPIKTSQFFFWAEVQTRRGTTPTAYTPDAGPDDFPRAISSFDLQGEANTLITVIELLCLTFVDVIAKSSGTKRVGLLIVARRKVSAVINHSRVENTTCTLRTDTDITKF